MVSPILYIVGIIIMLFISTVIINILQNGKIVEDPSSLPEIEEKLGKSTHLLNIDDLRTFNKSQLMYLFQKASVPSDISNIIEFDCENTSAAILSPVVKFYTDRMFGSGKWIGKKFNFDDMKGINIFSSDNGIEYERIFDLLIQKSRYDMNDALHLIYKKYNKSIFVHSMHDEVRKINDNLYIGMGTTAWGFGKINPSPFFLVPKNTEDND